MPAKFEVHVDTHAQNRALQMVFLAKFCNSFCLHVGLVYLVPTFSYVYFIPRAPLWAFRLNL